MSLRRGMFILSPRRHGGSTEKNFAADERR
jgi:hypothetical protein